MWHPVRTYTHAHNTVCPAPTHYFLERATYAVGEIKFDENLPQYKGRAIGKNFIPRIFCRKRYFAIV